jgi:hypothetical protein
LELFSLYRVTGTYFIGQEKVDTWISATTGTDICDKVVSKPLELLYDLLFSNSNFYFNFQKDRGTTELDIGNWVEDDQYVVDCR